MKQVKIECYLDIDDTQYPEGIDEIKKLEHHADYFLDLDSYPEVNSVYGFKVTEIDGDPIIEKPIEEG